MQYFSFHTHSTFCDGKATVEEVCRSAIAQGLSAVGFSSHAPVSFDAAWAMKFEDLSDYVNEVERCRLKFRNELLVYRSLETDFIAADKSIPFEEVRKIAKLDYIIGSVHLVYNPNKDNVIWFLDGPPVNYEKGINECFDGDVRLAVMTYFKQIQEMVRTQHPDVIAHMDKVVMNNKGRFFNESEQWYQDVMEETLQVIAKHGAIIEINTRGIYRGKYHTWFPNEEVIKRCIDLNIPLTVSVDAHHPDELRAGFEDAIGVMQKLGCQFISVFEGSEWKQKPINDVMSS